MKNLITSLIISILLLFAGNVFAVPILNSYPSAAATIYLDFDGQLVQGTIWNNGNPINCAPSGLDDTQITEIFQRVAEDYRPFDLNITTDEAVYLAANPFMRMRIIITPTNSWSPGVGGAAWVNSFVWGDDTPAFVFNNMLGPNNPKMVAESAAHEGGHTLGLAHQSKYGNDCNTPTEVYSLGVGAGEIAWAPIMGNSYYRNMSNWNNGPTPYGCTVVQDNLTTITTQNGFGYRVDDYSETLNGSTYALSGNNFTANGNITTNTDVDAFRFTIPQNSNFHFTAMPYSIGANSSGANLDVRVELYSSSTNLIRVYDPLNSMSVTIDTVLNAGTYFIKISGAGNENTSSYGSLGSYEISGNFGALPIRSVILSGKVDKNQHELNWSIVADEPIRTIEVQASTNGTSFGAITSMGGTSNQFSYEPSKNNTFYYRLKVTSVIDQIVYSNTVALKAGGTNDIFNVSTFVQSEVVVNASENYQYLVTDINGRVVSTGKGNKGLNRINVSNQSSGMYIIQLFSNNQRQTERIIKQ